jgi:hypothetical protein
VGGEEGQDQDGPFSATSRYTRKIASNAEDHEW